MKNILRAILLGTVVLSSFSMQPVLAEGIQTIESTETSTSTSSEEKVSSEVETKVSEQKEMNESSEPAKENTRATITEQEVRQRYDLDADWVALVPGVSEDGYFKGSYGTVGFRGMGTQDTLGDMNGGNPGYVDMVYREIDNQGYVYKNTNNQSAKRIFAYDQTKNSYKKLNRQEILKEGEFFHFKNSKNQQLKAVGVLNDYDVILSIDIYNERQKEIGHKWELVNTTIEPRVLGLYEIVDTEVAGVDNVPLYSLGGNRGFKMVAGEKELSITFASQQGEFYSDVSGFEALMYKMNMIDQQPSKDLFGSLLQASSEFEAGDVLLSNRDSMYRVITNLVTCNQGEKVTLEERIYLGDEQIPSLDISSELPNKVYSSKKIPVTMNIQDEVGTTEKVFLKVNDDEEKEIATVDIDLETDTAKLEYVLNAGDLHIGKNKLEFYVKNDNSQNSESKFLDIEVIELKAEPNIVKTNLNKIPEPMLDSFIKQYTSINTPQVSYLENGEPKVDAIGFSWAKVNFADSVTPEMNHIDVVVPVNVKGENTQFFDKSLIALDAKDVFLTLPEVKECGSNEELLQLILDKSKAKAWTMDKGDELEASVISTTVKPIKGKYSAVLTVPKDDYQESKTITVEVGGDFSIKETPETISFGEAKISSKTNYISKEQDLTLTLDTSLGIDWTLAVKASDFQGESGEKISDLLVIKKGNTEEFINNETSSIIATGDASSATDAYKVTMNKEEGLLLKVQPAQVKAQSYESTVTWMLRNTPV